MYRVLEPIAEIVAALAIPAALIAAVLVFRFQFGAW